MKRRSSTINGSKETKTSEKKPQRQWSAQQWATEIDWEQRTKDYKYDMTTETRTDRPQIDTSRMNNRTTTHTSLQLPVPRDPAIAMIGLPRDEISIRTSNTHETIRPSYWSAFPETTSTSLTPRVRTSLTPESENEPEPESENEPDPEITENENEPDISGYENTNQPAKARTCPNQASPMLTRRSITKTLSRFSISTKPLSIATDMTELDTLDWPRLQLHDAGSLVYAYTDIPSMAWSAMRTPRSTTATTPWRRIASIR